MDRKDYGENEIFDEFTPVRSHERDLWAAVVLEAISNVQMKSTGWNTSLYFLKRNGNFDWICQSLGFNPVLASDKILKQYNTMNGRRRWFKRHTESKFKRV